LKAKLESGFMCPLQALSSRRFQHGFDRENMSRRTVT
jgi:hypothetical protein